MDVSFHSATTAGRRSGGTSSPLRYYLCLALGLALYAAALAVFAFALVKMLRIGTCASGGPYVSARECPSETMTWVISLVVSVFAGLIALAILGARGRAPGTSDAGFTRGARTGLLAWSSFFIVAGAAALYGALSGDAGPGGELGGIIVGAVFIPMGALPLLLGGLGMAATRKSDKLAQTALSSAGRRSASTAPPPPPPPGAAFGSTTSSEEERRRAARETARRAFGGGDDEPRESAGSRERTSPAPQSKPDWTPRVVAEPWRPTPSPASGDPLERLEQLAKMRAEGLITEEEFAKAKARLLNDL